MAERRSENTATTPSGKLRAASLGLQFQGAPGRLNSITDVEGVSVGYATIVEGDGQLVVGKGQFGQVLRPFCHGLSISCAHLLWQASLV